MAMLLQRRDNHVVSMTLKLSIKNTLAEIAGVNSRFNEFAVQHALADTIRQKTNIALDELLNNTITYAFSEGDEHEIEVLIRLTDHRLVITIMDEGRPFNPFAHENPDTQKSLQERELGGLGIHIVRKIMDDVSYERRMNRNVVKLVKNL